MEPRQIGRVFGTEKKPNTAYTFSFWAERDAAVGIGTLIKVAVGEVTVYGVVVEAQGFNDLESPLHEYLAHGEDPTAVPPTERPEIRVFLANVLRREPEEPIGAVPIGSVWEATEKDVQIALRTEKYVEKFGIPVGAYGQKDNPIAVHLDERFLLGPEAGHLNMTGTSGLAAKTSFILFLLQSIFQTHRDEVGANGEKGVAALLFNTKGSDLLYLDQDGTSELDALDYSIYDACGLQPKPFERVKYYAPYSKDGFNLLTIRRNEELEAINPTRPITFGLRDVVRHAEVLLNRDDLDAKADGYLLFLNDRYVEVRSSLEGKKGGDLHADSLAELLGIVKDHISAAEGSPGGVLAGHSQFTIRKMYNRLGNLERRFSGIIAEHGAPTGPFDGPFEAGAIYVVDVAGLSSEAQDLVFAGFITTLKEKMEAQELGVGKLVVMLDELNKYAPSGGQETYVVKSLKEIAARGRYMGLTLFGAQQFRSRVDKEVIGNAATHAFGHIETEELAQPGYSYFSSSVKEKLGALNPGEILIKHPHFAQPIFVRFPKPASMKGSDGMRRYVQAKERNIGDLIMDQVRSRGGNISACQDALSSLAQDIDTLSGVLRQLRRLDEREDPLPVLRSGRRAAAVRREAVAVIDDVDPFENI